MTSRQALVLSIWEFPSFHFDVALTSHSTCLKSVHAATLWAKPGATILPGEKADVQPGGCPSPWPRGSDISLPPATGGPYRARAQSGPSHVSTRLITTLLPIKSGKGNLAAATGNWPLWCVRCWDWGRTEDIRGRSYWASEAVWWGLASLTRHLLTHTRHNIIYK